MVDFIDPDFLDPDEVPKGASFSPGVLDFLMGAPRKGYTASKTATAARVGAGPGEAALNIGTGMGSALMHIPRLINNFRDPDYVPSERGAFDDAFKQASEEYTYQPRTEMGQDLAEGAGAFMQQVGIPLGAVGHTLPPLTNTIQPRVRIPKQETIPGEISPTRDVVEAQKLRNEQPQGTLFVDPDAVASENLATKIPEAPETLALAKARARQLEQEANGRADTMFVDPDGIVSKDLSTKIPEQRNTVDYVKAQQAKELAETARQMELPSGEQLDLFTPEQRALDFQFEQPKVGTESPTSKSVTREVSPQYQSLKEYEGMFNKEELNKAYKELDNPSSKETIVLLTPEQFHQLAEIRPEDFASSESRRASINEALDSGKGLDDIPYLKGVMENGEFKVETHNGRHRMDVLGERGVPSVPVKLKVWRGDDFQGFGYEKPTSILGQTGERISAPETLTRAAPEAAPTRSTFDGAIELVPMEERPSLPDTIQTPRSESMIAARAAERTKADILRKAVPEAPLKEWLDVNTLPEAYKLSETEKDIGKGSIGRNMAAGIQGVTIMSGHPMLRYFRKAFADARGEVARLSQEYITNKENGFVTKVQDLSSKESIDVVKFLNEADKQQVRITPEMMEKLKFNEKQKALIESFQRAADAEITLKNKVRTDLGFKPITSREGWFPGIFKGSYKTLVWDKEGHIVGFIGQDTKLQQKAAIEHYKKTYPDAVFGTMTHQGLGRANKVDAFSGMSDVLAILAKEDPKMKALLDKSQEASSVINNKLFGIDKHDLQKKGITGNEGNKPWLSPEKNAKQALQAAAEYFEAAYEHHTLQKPLHDVNKVVIDPEFSAPNVQKYLQDYAEHVSGRTSHMGEAINSAIDSAFNAFGVGSTIPLKGANAIKAGMSRMFMGFNPAFLASQLAQPFQLAFPLAGTFATRLGMPQHMVANAMGRGSVWALSENMAKWYDAPNLAIAPEYIKEAIQYAKNRGLYAFNELELAHNATKGKTRRALGAAADFTISTGDKMTKLPTYLGFVELFKDAGIENKIAYALAEKATESSMVSYHPWERPMMYQKMGVVGQFAGGLTTYKHASTNLQAKLVQEAFGQQKNFKPLIASGLALMVFAGITGLPAYAELDQLYSKVHELYAGKPSTIREDFLQKLPEYTKSGAISAATDLNLQAKWSAADMVPDSLAKAASPHMEGAYKIAEAAAAYAVNPDTVNKANLLMMLTPSGLKGFTEEAVRKDAQGRVLDSKGLPVSATPRSEADWSKRKWTGVSLLNETIENQDLFKDKQAQAYMDKQIKDKSTAVKQAFIGNDFTRMSKLLSEYTQLAGPEATKQLLDELGTKTTVDKNLGARQRAQGTPNTVRGVQKYENYNDGK